MSSDTKSDVATGTEVAASHDVGASSTTTASSAPAPMTSSATTAFGAGLLQRKVANRLHRAQARGAGGGVENPQASFDKAVGGGGGEVPHRAEMERSFGQDFSGVQSHVGKHPEMESLGAQAATQGETIAFGTASPSKELVAHELTHVVQNRQSGGGGGVSNKSEVSDPGSAAEVEADAVGARAAAGEKVTVHAAPDAMTHGSWTGSDEKKADTPAKAKTPQETITDAIKAGDAAGIKAAATTPELQRYAIAQTVALQKDELLTDYAGLIDYMDHTPGDNVEKLGSDTKFVNQCAKVFSNEQFANLTVRMILRVPGTVVEAGAARTEAIRILTSQLRDKEVCKNLLAKKARVIIVPRNKLMTDLPEFKSAQGTYTFDGRPWDTTRGLGGQNTAITEENLLGLDKVDGDTSRKGWKNKADYDKAIGPGGHTSPNEAGKDGPTDADAMTYKPGTYCSGYSTTNHEFYHTIHQFGLNAADSKTILDEYNAKRAKPKETQWADGPRTLKSNAATQIDNYSSSSHWEYFAQTGCAYQSTNKGTDPSTGNDRNNGKAWVETNEPKLTPIYSKITSNEALTNVNPQEQRKKDDEAKAKAEKEKLEKEKAPAAAPTGAKPPAAGPTAQADPAPGGGDTVGLVQHV